MEVAKRHSVRVTSFLLASLVLVVLIGRSVRPQQPPPTYQEDKDKLRYIRLEDTDVPNFKSFDREKELVLRDFLSSSYVTYQGNYRLQNGNEVFILVSQIISLYATIDGKDGSRDGYEGSKNKLIRDGYTVSGQARQPNESTSYVLRKGGSVYYATVGLMNTNVNEVIIYGVEEMSGDTIVKDLYSMTVAKYFNYKPPAPTSSPVPSPSSK